MNKTKLILLSAISLASLSLFACSSDEGGDKYDYCVSIEQQACLLGPFSSCEEGWLLSNSCQYESASFPSSSDKDYISSSSVGGDVSFTDKGNDISNYATKKIGDQTWMAENLNYKVAGSKCYGEDGVVYVRNDIYETLTSIEIQANCDKYGRLYDWATAMALPSSCNSSECAGQIQAKHQGVCPSGWHIPNDEEWSILINYVDGVGGSENRSSTTAGKYLKSTNEWNDYYDAYGNGEDTYGFAALLGGAGYSDGRFRNVGNIGGWWSASEYYGYYDYYANSNCRHMVYEDDFTNWGNYYKADLHSVRCVKD